MYCLLPVDKVKDHLRIELKPKNQSPIPTYQFEMSFLRRLPSLLPRYHLHNAAAKNQRSISSTPIKQNLVPVVLESGTTGERAFDIYSRLLRERIICVHGEVTDAMASVVTAQLLFLEAKLRKSQWILPQAVHSVSHRDEDNHFGCCSQMHRGLTRGLSPLVCDSCTFWRGGICI